MINKSDIQYKNVQQQVKTVPTQEVIDHPGFQIMDIFSDTYSWWWLGVFVPISIALITTRRLKKFAKK